MNDHNLIMTNLKHSFSKITELIEGKKVVYLDIPVYNNIGDLLIMQGTLSYLQTNKVKCKHIFSAHFSHFGSVKNGEVILLQGGGNFGDMYDLHQKFREKIIKRFPKNRIIILPQTVHFELNENYEKCCELFSQHDDLHFFVRDKNSYRMAVNMTPNVTLLPDMAHHLYPIKQLGETKNNMLFIKRKDIEATGFTLDKKPDLELDWQDLLKLHNIWIKIMSKLIKLSSRLKIMFLNRLLTKVWIKYTYYLTAKAIKLFSKYGEIYTTRLHGHILACLMDKSNIVFDNSYGKNSSYIHLWTNDSSIIKLIGSKKV